MLVYIPATGVGASMGILKNFLAAGDRKIKLNNKETVELVAKYKANVVGLDHNTLPTQK